LAIFIVAASLRDVRSFYSGGVIRAVQMKKSGQNSNNPSFSRRWFPNYELNADIPALIDHRYDDFDAQSERLIGHDQTYLQLSDGQFHGRFLSGILGPNVSIHIEYCNQALEQIVGGSSTHFTLGIILSDGPAFRVNGQGWHQDDVMISPPGCCLHINSPVNGLVMAIAVNENTLLQQSALSPRAMQWLLELTDDIGLFHAPRFAARLREDSLHALEGVSVSGADDSGIASTIGEALIAGIASKLSMEHAARSRTAKKFHTGSFLRFMEFRSRIHAGWDRIDGFSDLAAEDIRLKRSMQDAFTKQLSVGPLTYLRILRLHLARRALLQRNRSAETIGDIAANYGFWNWSRFTQQYRKQFGELPSDTRMRL